MILRGGVLTKEATISLTFIGQWSSTIRFLIWVWIWGHLSWLLPIQDCWDKFRPMSNVLWLHYLLTKVHYSECPETSNICISCRWLLRARSTIPTRQKRRPNFTNQVEHENPVIASLSIFIFEMNLREQTFRPLKNERLEEAAAGVQLGCWVGEAGGGEGGRHVKGSWHLATSILKCDRCDCVFATSNHAEEVKR